MPLDLRFKVYKYVFDKSVLDIESSGDVAGETYKRFITRKLNCRLVFGTYDDHMIARLITWRVMTPGYLIEWRSQRPTYQEIIYRLIIHSGTRREKGEKCLHVFKHSPCFYASSSWMDDQDMCLKMILPNLKRLSFEIHKSQIIVNFPEEKKPDGVYETLLEWKEDAARVNPGVQVRFRYESTIVCGLRKESE